MGQGQSQAGEDEVSLGRMWETLATWTRNPVRVRSAALRLTEWDDIGDKNAAYWSGQRAFKIDPSFYALPVCETHAHKTWWWTDKNEN